MHHPPSLPRPPVRSVLQENGGDLTAPLLLPGPGSKARGAGEVGPSAADGAMHPVQSFVWLDAATSARLTPGGSPRFTAQQVEEVKLVLRMLPIFFTTIFYWTVYNQVGGKGVWPGEGRLCVCVRAGVRELREERCGGGDEGVRACEEVAREVMRPLCIHGPAR